MHATTPNRRGAPALSTFARIGLALVLAAGVVVAGMPPQADAPAPVRQWPAPAADAISEPLPPTF